MIESSWFLVDVANIGLLSIFLHFELFALSQKGTTAEFFANVIR